MKLWRLCALVTAALVLSCGLASYAQKITVDPNAGGVQKPAEEAVDTRLAQKITYVAWHTPIKTILDDLSQTTGVTLNAGYNKQDWQVRDRKMNIYVKDVTLAELMNSIARVMKFKWSKNTDKTPPTYRLIADYRLLAKLQAEASRRENELKREVTRRRSDLVEELAKVADLSGTDLQSLKQSNPYLYLCAETGFAKLATSVFADKPELKDKFINDSRNTIINNDQFSQIIQQNCIDAMRKYHPYSIMMGAHSKLPDNLDENTGKVELHFEFMTGPSEYSIRGRLNDFGSLSTWLDGSYGLGNFKNPNAKSTQMWAKSVLTAQEHGASTKEYYSNFYSGVDIAEIEDAKEIEYYLMLDPVTKHADEPDLHEQVSLALSDEVKKAQQNELKAAGDGAYTRMVYQFAQKNIADAAPVNIVSDSYSVVLAYEAQLPDKDELPAILDKLCDIYRCNWEKHGSIIEIRRRDWFRRRSSQIPDEWVQPWRDELKKYGILSMDNYLRMAVLTDEQVEENVRTDQLLSKVCGKRWETGSNQGLARFYIQLSDSQKDQIMTEQGLDIHRLTPGQWKYYTEMFEYGRRYTYTQDLGEFIDFGAMDARIKGTREQSEDGTVICRICPEIIKDDGSSKKDMWWFFLRKIQVPKDEAGKATEGK